MTIKFLFRGATILSACCIGSPLLADPMVSSGSATIAEPAADPFQQAIAAQAVAAFARRQKDPQAMLVAARMLQDVPVHDGAASQPTATAATFSPAGLFGEAKVLAQGDPALLTQIRIAQGAGNRGVFASAFGKGLVRLVREVAARGTYRFDIDAVGGQVLRIGAIGDVGTAMLLRLVDAAGRLVCIDDSGDYAPVCATMPHAAGRYHVEVANRSAKPSNTVILSN
jgi:hypothetical protein